MCSSAAGAKRVMETYPHLEAQDEVAIKSLLDSAAKEGADPNRAWDTATQRQIVSRQPKKAAKVFLSEGLAQLDSAEIATLHELHPEPVSNRASPMPRLPPAEERRRHANASHI